MALFSKVLLGLATVTLLAGCTKSATNTTTETTPVQTSPTVGPTGSGEGVDLPITLSEYAIAPKIIEVRAGQQNTLRVTNTGSLEHTFTIPDLAIDITLPAGGSEIVSINNPAAGTYDVNCTVAGHEALGMEAQVIAQ